MHLVGKNTLEDGERVVSVVVLGGSDKLVEELGQDRPENYLVVIENVSALLVWPKAFSTFDVVSNVVDDRVHQLKVKSKHQYFGMLERLEKANRICEAGA